MTKRDIVVVTGGARGIGFGIARRMAGEGYDVALFDRNEAALDEAVAELRRIEGVNATRAVVDVTSGTQVEGARVGLTQCTGGGIAGVDHAASSVHVLGV